MKQENFIGISLFFISKMIICSAHNQRNNIPHQNCKLNLELYYIAKVFLWQYGTKIPNDLINLSFLRKLLNVNN